MTRRKLLQPISKTMRCISDIDPLLSPSDQGHNIAARPIRCGLATISTPPATSLRLPSSLDLATSPLDSYRLTQTPSYQQYRSSYPTYRQLEPSAADISYPHSRIQQSSCRNKDYQPQKALIFPPLHQEAFEGTRAPSRTLLPTFQVCHYIFDVQLQISTRS